MKHFPARPDDARENAKPRRETEGSSPRLRIETVRNGASGLATIAAGGSSFCLRPADALALGLEIGSLIPGAELGETEAELLAAASESYAAEKRGLALIARAEQSAFMLRAKLQSRGFSARAVRLALDRLVAAGLLDDARFARLYAASRLRRRAEGPASLAAALRDRGVDAETADSAVAGLIGRASAPAGRRDALEKAAAREMKRSDGDRDAVRERLRGLGFGSAEIRECLERIDTE